jgi:hypothetical protein
MNNTVNFGTFKRLINLSDYAVPVTKDAADVQEVYRIESVEVQVLWDLLIKIFKEQYIYTADEYGLDQWEKILELQPEPTDSADTRRFVILAALLGQRPYTMIKLRELLDTLCGEGNYKIIEDFNNYRIKFKISLGVKKQRDIVANMLKQIIPMNLIFDVDLLYNRHIDLSRFTHKELAEFTHFALNQEVLP